MRTIYKYPLPFSASTPVQIHSQPRFLHVDEQDGRVMVWAEVDTRCQKESWTLCAVMTGSDMSEVTSNAKYIGTVQIRSIVAHVYAWRQAT